MQKGRLGPSFLPFFPFQDTMVNPASARDCLICWICWKSRVSMPTRRKQLEMAILGSERSWRTADHIGAVPGNDLADPHQLAGPVLQGNQQVGIPTGGHKAPGDHPGEYVHVDIPSGDHADHLFPLDGELVEHGGRHGSRPPPPRQ